MHMHKHAHIPETSASSFFPSFFLVNFLNLAHPESALPEKQDHQYSAWFISACEDHVGPKAPTVLWEEQPSLDEWQEAHRPGVGKGWRRRRRKRKQSPPFVPLKDWWVHLPDIDNICLAIKIDRARHSQAATPAGGANGSIWEGHILAVLEAWAVGTQWFSKAAGPAQTCSPHTMLGHARGAAHLWWNWTSQSPEESESCSMSP